MSVYSLHAKIYTYSNLEVQKGHSVTDVRVSFTQDEFPRTIRICIVTTRNSRCGKVMFSQASVNLFGGGGGV